MAFPSLRFRRGLRLVLGCGLLVSGAFGSVYAFSAARAQRAYLRAKYGFYRGTSVEVPCVTNAEAAIRLARPAMARYSYNYYFPAYVAKVCLEDAVKAYDELEALDALEDTDVLLAGMEPAERFARREALRVQCEDLVRAAGSYSKEAVALNPYDEEARLGRAYALLSNGQADEAVEFWRPIVDLEYWNPRHHDIWAELLLAEGSDENRVLASREWFLVKDADLRRRLQQLDRELEKSSGKSPTPKGT